jgi:hypothetical protein
MNKVARKMMKNDDEKGHVYAMCSEIHDLNMLRTCLKPWVLSAPLNSPNRL